MPIYEYRCPNGHTFEVFQRMSDPPASVCEVCGASPVEKLLFPVAVHFKGSGFYSTDYGAKAGAAKDGESSSGNSDSGTESSTSDSSTSTKSSSKGGGGKAASKSSSD